MIENVPSIYNQPSVYNGGGGLPGDFGSQGVSILPEQYRQVAAVYIPDGANASSKKIININDFGLSDFDTTDIKVECGIYRPNIDYNHGTNLMYFFQVYNNKKVYVGFYTYSDYNSFYSRNGGTAQTDLTTGTHIQKKSIGVISIDGSVVKYNDSVIRNDVPVTTFADANKIQPYVYGGSSDTFTCDIATRFLKIYSGGLLRFFFIPVVRESDGVPGLYDVVNGIFSDNQYCKVLETIDL